MTSVCRRCDEVVHHADRICSSCGADLRVQVPLLVDLTREEALAAREQRALLAEAVAVDPAEEPLTKPRWGANTPTMLELELAPIRIAARPTLDDVLPAAPPARRGWRRR